MPLVVSRWQAVLSKKPLRARKMNDATVCGACLPSSLKVIVPQVVATVAVQSRPAARLFGGAALNCCGLAIALVVVLGQALLVAGPDGVGLGALAAGVL